MKLILIINDTKVVYNSLTSIHKDFPQYSYHPLRQIYLKSTNLHPRKLHNRNKQLFNQIKIIDFEVSPIALHLNHPSSPSASLSSS